MPNGFRIDARRLSRLVPHSPPTHIQPLPGLYAVRGANRAAPAGVSDRLAICRYFAFTLDVMDAITPEAILNWSLRLLMPCRRAIQSKSV